MAPSRNIHGHYYPAFHNGWGGFAEELFHYTSRYYHATECFLRHLAQDEGFAMSGYKAARMSEAQRDLMAAVLSCMPDRDAALAAISVVSAVVRGDGGVEAQWLERYRVKLQDIAAPAEALSGQPHRPHYETSGASPLDPFLSLAERLHMPVAVKDRHVEVCMHSLAEHLDSPNVALRTNLHDAVLMLHNAGYTLRNHPHLTHAEAHDIGDED